MMAVVVKRMGRDRGKKRRVSGEAIKRRVGNRRSTFPTPNLLMKKDVPNKQQIKDMKLVSCPKCPINFANSSPPIERERIERWRILSNKRTLSTFLSFIERFPPNDLQPIIQDSEHDLKQG